MSVIMTKIIAAAIAALSAATQGQGLVVAVNSVEDHACTVNSEGQEICDSAFDQSYIDDDSDDSDDDSDDEEGWEGEEERVGCDDHGDECQGLAEEGECDKNPGYMKYECAASCGTCAEYNAAHEAWRDGSGDGPCTDKYAECKNWAHQGECAFNPNFMLVECERSCMICFEDTNQFGFHQEPPPEDDEHHAQTVEVIEKSIQYMMEIWKPNPENNRINYKCRNMDSQCSFWAVDECDGEEENSEWMRSNCAPACQTCHLLDIQLRCPIEEENELVMQSPGGLNALFEAIADDAGGTGEYLKYRPRIFSRPRLKRDGTTAPGIEKDGPWIVFLENFITDEEAAALIAAGHGKGYERSSDIGVENPDGSHEDEVSEGRTSTNSWCDEELCNNDPVIGPVVERIATLTQTSANHSEHLQLLRYEPGQHYNQHHDYIEYQQGMPCGVRMLTLFLYLNDVEEGGGTRFPLLDITVQPQKGGALLWPSVLDEDIENKDFRTDHEALPVVKGIKYGANAWIHTRNYREAEENDCT